MFQQLHYCATMRCNNYATMLSNNDNHAGCLPQEKRKTDGHREARKAFLAQVAAQRTRKSEGVTACTILPRTKHNIHRSERSVGTVVLR